MTPAQKTLMLAIPHMKCANLTEFKQRLQWLSEGMLRNHMESALGQQVNLVEIEQYRKFKLDEAQASPSFVDKTEQELPRG